MGMPAKDMTGLRFGKWHVVREVGRANKQVLWECECDCGELGTIRGGTLRQGLSTSCGKCLDLSAIHTKHGHGYDPLYDVWHAMIDRCSNPKNKKFADYGGRGISVCTRWQDVSSFIEDMSPRPVGHSIDRIDVNGNYEPANCRWATHTEQTRNARSNIVITHQGKTQCLGAWAEELGIKYATLYGRYVTQGRAFPQCI